MTAPWLAVMQALDGTHAEGDNPAIMAWPKFIGQTYPEMASYCAGYTHDSISWCGLTVAYCMAKVGIRPVFGASDTDRFLWALAWKQFGSVVNKGEEQPGDVLVFVCANGGHHVTLYEGTDARGFYICHGGNQSHAVTTQHYSPAYCVGIRRAPVAVAQPQPAPVPAPVPAHLPPVGSLPPLVALAEEAAALVIRQLIERDPAGTQRAAEIRSKLLIAREVADAGLALLDRVAPVGSAPVPSPGVPSLPLPPWLKSSPAPTPSPPSSSSPAPVPGQRFLSCVTEVLKDEGGNDDDPRDPGGRTSRGITAGDWDKWRQTHPGLPADVWQAPQDQVIAIYRQNYWNVLHCDDLPAGVDYAVFDEGVLQGVGHAVLSLESAVGTTQDGEIGPITIAAAAQADPKALINRLCDGRLAHLRSLSTWSTFGHGWTNRVTHVRTVALAMTKTSPSLSSLSGVTTMTMPSTQTAIGTPEVAAPVGSAWTSKINVGELVKFGAMLLAVKGVNIPPDIQNNIIIAIAAGGAIFTWVARTFFTTKITPQSLPQPTRNQLGV